MPVFDTAHFANALGIRGSVLWIPSVLTSSILLSTPASKVLPVLAVFLADTACTGSTLEYCAAVTTRCVCRYPPTASTCYGKKLSQSMLHAHSLIIKYTASICAIETHVLLVRYSSSTSMCTRDHTVATAAAARVRALHASQKAS